MNYSSLLSLTATSALVLGACSGSSASPVSTPESTQVTTATLDAVVATYCDKLSTCFGDVFSRATFKDQATCRARLGIEFGNSMKGPGVAITEAQGQACLTAAKAAACGAIFDGGVSACQFKGTLADGATCTSESQCQSGSCFVAEKASCGKCAPRAAAGADCSAQQCAAGLFCADSKKCVMRGAEGATCDATSAPCVFGIECFEGKCTKPLAKDAACKAGSGRSCDIAGGLYCKPTALPAADGTCAPYTLGLPGQQCGLSVTPLDYAVCVDDSQCIGAKGTTRGLCTAHLADGAACGNGAEPVACQFPAKCRDGKCAVLDPTLCK